MATVVGGVHQELTGSGQMWPGAFGTGECFAMAPGPRPAFVWRSMIAPTRQRPSLADRTMQCCRFMFIADSAACIDVTSVDSDASGEAAVYVLFVSCGEFSP